MELRNGRTVLPAFSGGTPKPSNDAGAVFLAPLAVDEVVLKSCSLIAHEPGQPDLRVGLTSCSSQQFSTADGGGYMLRSLVGAFNLTDAIGAAGSFSLTTGEDRHRARLSLEDGRLAALDRLLPTGFDSSMFGTLSLTSAMSFSARTFALEQIEAKGRFSRFHPVSAGFESSGAGPDRALEFSFSGSPDKLDYAVSGLQVTRPCQRHSAAARSFPETGPSASTAASTPLSAISPTPEKRPTLLFPAPTMPFFRQKGSRPISR